MALLAPGYLYLLNETKGERGKEQERNPGKVINVKYTPA